MGKSAKPAGCDILDKMGQINYKYILITNGHEWY